MSCRPCGDIYLFWLDISIPLRYSRYDKFISFCYSRYDKSFLQRLGLEGKFVLVLYLLAMSCKSYYIIDFELLKETNESVSTKQQDLRIK